MYSLCNLTLLSMTKFPPNLRFHTLQFPLRIVFQTPLSAPQLCEAQRLCCVKNNSSQDIVQDKQWWSLRRCSAGFYQKRDWERIEQNNFWSCMSLESMVCNIGVIQMLGATDVILNLSCLIFIMSWAQWNKIWIWNLYINFLQLELKLHCDFWNVQKPKL